MIEITPRTGVLRQIMETGPAVATAWPGRGYPGQLSPWPPRPRGRCRSHLRETSSITEMKARKLIEILGQGDRLMIFLFSFFLPRVFLLP